jgi:hypothetical protein
MCGDGESGTVAIELTKISVRFVTAKICHSGLMFVGFQVGEWAQSRPPLLGSKRNVSQIAQHVSTDKAQQNQLVL